MSAIASIGDMVRQYQIMLDPDQLRACNTPHAKVIDAVRCANHESGSALLEPDQAAYRVRGPGHLHAPEIFRKIPLASADAGGSVRRGQMARIQVGPETRCGVAGLNGEGDVAGAVFIMWFGKNALQTIGAVKAKLDTLR